MTAAHRPASSRKLTEQEARVTLALHSAGELAAQRLVEGWPRFVVGVNDRDSGLTKSRRGVDRSRGVGIRLPYRN